MKKNKWIPIVIILILVIAIPVSWKLYEDKKEADRQALINMGDELNAAWKEFEESSSKIDENNKLAEEYTEIMESIVKGRVSAEDVKDKVCAMEEKLMEIYPTIYTEPSSVCKK